MKKKKKDQLKQSSDKIGQYNKLINDKINEYENKLYQIMENQNK